MSGSKATRTAQVYEALRTDILNTRIRSLPGVYLAETLVYLKTLKQQYNWGTR